MDSDLLKLMLATSPHQEFLEDQEGRVLFASDSCAKLFAGCGPTGLEDAVTESRRESYREFKAGIMRSGEPAQGIFPLRILGGDTVDALVSGSRARSGQGAALLRLSVIPLDGAVRWQLSRLRELVDPLTGLAGRDAVLDRLMDLHLAVETDPDHSFSAVYVDIDRLKKYNDAFGRDVGNLIIVEAAKRLRQAAVPGALVARLNGDEFFILQDGLTNSRAVAATKVLMEAMNAPFDLSGQEALLSAGYGLVMSPILFSSPDDLIRKAKLAARAAKTTRRKFRVFHRRMLERSIRNMELEIDMYRALKENQFHVEYQPIFSLEARRMAGVEALLRWNHPKWGRVEPSDFIPIAEETGFIVPLGQWVLEQSCRDMMTLLAAAELPPDMSMSVNLSLVQLNLHDIVDRILDTLERIGLDPARLRIEITESVAMSNPEVSAEKIKTLRAKGIRVSIDDFGTGYSSLSQLQSLPIDTIKVDKTFVSRMDKNVRKRKLVRSVISLAQSLRMNVVAEGVEMNEQWSMLRALDCEGGQGFLFERPMRLEALLQLIEKRQVLPEDPPHKG